MVGAASENNSRAYSQTRSTLWHRLALVGGYIGIIIAVLTAHRSPADGYEWSIYAATPTLVWVGASVAVLVSLIVGLKATDSPSRTAALVLLVSAFVLIVGLPIIRAYEFFGTGDSLSHIGWVRDVASGQRTFNSLLYPALHTMTLSIASVGATTLWQGMLFSVLVYALVFVVFVPIVAREFSDDPRIVIVATFAASMLLPINNVSAHLSGHPSTLAVLFVPVVIAALVRYLREPLVNRFSPGPFGVLLSLFTGSILLVHPQQAMNILLLLITILGIQLFRRWRYVNVTRLHPVNAQTLFLGAVFAMWVWSHDRAVETTDSYVSILLSSGTSSSELAQRSSGLTEIGASLGELYVKLFLVSTIFVMLAVGLVLHMLVRANSRQQNNPLVLRAIGLGTLPTLGLFLIYFFANIGTMYIRQLGFVMAIVTILGAIAIHQLITNQFSLGNGVWTSLVTVAMIGMLILSVLVLFPSPFIYKPNPHVSEDVINGYQQSYTAAAKGVTFLGVRQGPARYHDAVTGTDELTPAGVRRTNGVSSKNMSTGLADIYQDPHYFVVTRHDKSRELRAFRSLRYDQRDFAVIKSQHGVHRVRDTGGFDLYIVY